MKRVLSIVTLALFTFAVLFVGLRDGNPKVAGVKTLAPAACSSPQVEIRGVVNDKTKAPIVENSTIPAGDIVLFRNYTCTTGTNFVSLTTLFSNNGVFLWYTLDSATGTTPATWRQAGYGKQRTLAGRNVLRLYQASSGANVASPDTFTWFGK